MCWVWLLTEPGTLIGADLKMFTFYELGYQYRTVTLADPDWNWDGVRTYARHCLEKIRKKLLVLLSKQDFCFEIFWRQFSKTSSVFPLIHSTHALSSRAKNTPHKLQNYHKFGCFESIFPAYYHKMTSFSEQNHQIESIQYRHLVVCLRSTGVFSLFIRWNVRLVSEYFRDLMLQI